MLTSAPGGGGNATVTPTSADNTIATVSSTLTFTADNWNDEQTVTVSGTEDGDASDETVTITHAVIGYDNIATAATVTVTVTDPDIPAVRFSRNAVTLTENANATYTVRLDTQPSGNVTITPDSDDDDVATVSGALVFTAGDWNEAQTVTVTGADDDNSETDTTTITHTVLGYGGVTAGDVAVTVTDTDTPSVTVSKATLAISEGSSGGVDNIYTVVLNTQPSGDVTVSLSSDNSDVTAGVNTLNFTTANWNTPQSVTISADEDDDGNDDTANITHTVSGANYGGAAISNNPVVVTVTDNDTDGITLSATALTVAENATENYTVRLVTQPDGEVTIMPVSGDTTIATVSGALVFTAANWNTAQQVTVTGIKDADAVADAAVSISHMVSGSADYAGVSVGPVMVTVTVTETDMRGVTISETSVDVTEGGFGIYTVVLTSAPSGGDVTVMPGGVAGSDLTLSRDGVALGSSGGLVFDSNNWNTAQTITLTATEDDDAVTDATVTITHAVAGSDYTGETAADVTVAITENDNVGITVTETTLTVNEGEFGSYTVVLTSAPSIGEVTVTPSSGDVSVVTVTTTALVFNANNWNMPQTVSVQGVADDDAVADAPVVITNTVTVSDGSSDYNGATAAGVTVTVNETGTAAVTISTPTLTVAEDGNNTYTVVLTSAPGGGGNATVTPTSADPTIATVSSALTFTATNWNDAQTVTVTGVEDGDAGNEMVSITHAVIGYDNIATAAAVTVTVTDPDIPAVRFSRNAVTLAENANATYTVRLDTQPSGNVTITPDSGDDDVATVTGALVFTAGNWDDLQTVTVTGADDDNSETDTTTITHTVVGYGGVTAGDVAVTVTDTDTPSVTISKATLAISEGSSSGAGNTYTVVLNTQPSGDVTVALSSDNSDVTAGVTTVNFTAANWNTPQSVVVSAAEDDDGNDDTANITHTVSGANYAGATISNNPVVVTVTDNDTRGVTIDPTSRTLTEGTNIGTYTVALTSAPVGGNVVITPTSDNDDVSVNPNTLNFNAANWNVAQTFRLTVAEDDDGNDDTANISHTVSGADYDSVTADDVMVTVTDNDIDGITLSATALTVAENATENYTVRLATQPDGEVTIMPVSGDTAIATVSGALVFTAANWNTAQQVTVTGVKDADAVADAAVSITHMVTGSVDYAGVSVGSVMVTVTVTETDMRGVMIYETSVEVTEGGSGIYTVVLTSAPVGGDVTVMPGGVAGSDLTLSRDGVALGSSGGLVFGSNNWNTAQTITLTAAEDDDAVADATVTITHAVAGADYTGETAASVTATITENDSVGITVTETTLTVDEREFGSYTVALTSAPSTGEVTVMPSSGDVSVVAVTTAALVFNANNWNMPQTVSVQGVADDDAVADAPVVITNTVTVSDASSDYNGATAAGVTVTVNETGTAAVTVSTPALTVAEDGDNTYTVVLTSAPGGGGDATVTPTSANNNIATVSSALTFTAGNWNDEQTVTVSGTEDGDASDEMVSITHTVSGYDNIATATAVTVTVTDPDIPAVRFSRNAVTLAENANATYTVRLDTQPSGNVTITPTSADPTVATVTGALVFTDSTWDTAQTVTVTGADDDNSETDTTTITHTVVGYGGVTAGDVAVTVTDTDTPSVTISKATLAIGEGSSGGVGNTYTVVLNTQPSGDVTVALSSDNSDVTVNTAAVNFTTANWNTPQSVVVSAAEDDDGNDDTASITHTVSGANYGGATISNNPVVVTVTDNDTRGITLSATALTVAENATENYTMRLATQPDGEVTVMPVSGDTGTVTVSGALVFTAANWNTAQQVVVTGIKDADAVADVAVSISHLVTGSADYAGVSVGSVTVTVTVTETDMRGVMISKASVDVTEGGSGIYTVVLTSAPDGGDVTVMPGGVADTDLTLSPSDAVVFGSNNWNTAQTITLTAAEDDDAVADATVTITHAVTGADYGSNNIQAANVTATITENDNVGITVTETTLTVDEREFGSYTVRLTSAPSAGEVTVMPSSGDVSVVTVTTAALVFDTNNWNMPQTVSVQGVADDDAVADAAVSITNAVAVSDASSDYNGATAAGVTVTVNETGTAAVTISTPNLTVPEDGNNTYTVMLTSAPGGGGNATVTPTSADDTIATVSSALTFTATNWNDAQTVTVSGTEDGDASNEMVSITHAVVGYDNIATAAAVTVTVTDPDIPAVRFSRNAVTLAENANATYTVRLDTQPSGNVTITPDSGSDDVATVSPTDGLVFTDSNWNEAQTVTVTGIDDDNSETDTATITHTVVGYGGVTAGDVAVTVTDTDTPSVTISKATLAIGEGSSNGAGNTYTVVLNTQPSGDVTVALSSDNSDVTVNAATVNFTTGNWNTPQMVVVSATEDDDGNDDTANITHTVTGANYGGATISNNPVVVTVTDNDTRGITLSATALTVAENATENYTVRLATQPDDEVTIMPLSGDTATATVSGALVFTAANWNTAQQVTVTGIKDADAVADAAVSITHTVSGSADYAGVSVRSVMVTVTVTETDTRGVMISETSVDVTEGGSGIYTVVLTSEPVGGGVTVTLGGVADTDLTLSRDGVAFGSSGGLVFGSNNWNTAQTITLTAAEDDDAVADATVTITHAVAGADYTGETAADVTVTITENDSVGITVTETTLTVDEREFGSYTVRLTSAPSVGEVTVMPSSGDVSVVTVTTAALVFDTNNWNMPQTISIQGVADDDAVADVAVSITNAVTVSDGSSDYNGATAAGVTVTVNETGTAAVTISTPTLTVDEDGDDTYTVALTSAPGGGGNATVTPTSADANIATVSSALTFTATNWNDAQTVTVSGTEDGDAGDEMVSITHAVVGYDNIATAAAVTVTVTDPDIPAVRLSRNAVTLAENANATYTVRLDTQPSGNVTITPDSADPTVATVSGALVFTDSNWDDLQTVTVTGADDDNSETDTTTITHTVVGYGGVTAGDVAVTVTDTDTPSVTISKATLAIGEGSSGGVGNTYTVVLNTQPSGDVTVALSSDNSDVTVNTAAVNFTTANWNTPQSVTVSAAEDFDGNDDTANITHTVTGANYGGATISNNPVVVTVTDNDTDGITLSATALTVAENATENYTVRLVTQPDGEVTVMPLSGDTAIATVSGALVFTAANWNVAQQVTVTGVKDADAVADVAVSISHMVTGSADYAGFSVGSVMVTVTVTEIDMRGVMISDMSVDVTEGGSDIYTVVLTSAPDGEDVTVTLGGVADTDLTLSPSGGLVFGSNNWSTAQTVTLTAAEDDDAVDDATVTITHAVAGADYGSNNIQAANVTATITENDTVGITVTQTTLTVDEREFGSYTVVLTSAPSAGNVTVTPSSGDVSVVTVTTTAALVFDTNNWNMPQTVSVQGVADDDAVADVAVSITNAVTVSDGSSDYASQSAASVTVTVTETGMAAVTISTPALTVDEGDNNTYTIVLTSAPGGGNATVTPTSADDTIATVSGALTFTATNWNDEQTVTVSGVEDADAGDEMVSITHTVSGYDNIATAATVAVTVTVTDTSERGVRLTEVSVSVTEGATTAYGVVLDTQPTDNVTVTPDSGDEDVATVTGALTFTTGNWNEAQSVTVTGAEDDNSETDTTTITHAVSGADYASVTVTADPVMVTVTDNDTPGVTVSDAALTVGEGTNGGVSNIYTVVLLTQPNGDVTVMLSSDNGDVTVGVAALNFGIGDWNVAQSVTISAAEDFDGNDDTASVTHTVSGANYDGAAITHSVVTVTVTDNDMHGVTLSGVPVGVTEGDTGNYTVRLATQPDGEVTITPMSGDTDIATVSGALTFTTGNWNEAQSVTVTGAEDDNADADTATITHTVSGADYGGVVTADDVTVTVTDNDTRGITLSPTALSVAENATGNYTVRLATQPDGEVTITPMSGDVATVTVSGALVFTDANWNVVQSVTVTGVTDADAVVADAVSIRHTVSGSADYAGVSAGSVTVTVTETDSRGVTISRADVGVTEGANATYTVVLTSAPLGEDVTVTPGGVANTDLTLSPSGALTFTATAGNWNIAQTITLNAAEDDDAVVDATVTITHAVAGADYTGETAADVTVTITENDSVGITVTETTLTVDEGEFGSYTVVLTAAPSAGNVTVMPNSGDVSVVIVTTTAALVFDTNNWNMPQTVSVQGVADDDAVADVAVTISNAVTVSDGSSDYNGENANDVTVTVNETGTAAVTISTPALTVDEDGNNTYTVVLTSAPSGGGDATVTPASDDPAIATVSSALTFTATNWNDAQTVTVSGTEDGDASNEMVSITHAVVGYDNITTAAAVTVTVTDPDIPAVRFSRNAVTLAENANATYTVRLDTQPDGNVTITPDSADPTVATVSGALVFTDSNWDDLQTVTVTGADDDNSETDTATITHTVVGYGGVTAGDVAVTVTDTDTPSVTVSKATLAIGEGSSSGVGNTYTVVLNTEPSGDVTVALSSDNSDVTAGVTTLNFTTANWNTPQSVTISAAEDDDGNDDTANITHTVSGANYGGAAISNNPVVVTVTDNNARGIMLSANTLSVAENATGNYTVRLTTEPDGNVTITPSSGDTATATVSGALVFTDTNWNTPQQVTVTGIKDADAVAAAVAISHTITGSADYAGISAGSVTVTVTETDSRGVTISTATVGVTEGESATYTVALTSAPSGGGVTVTPSSGDDAVAIVSPTDGLVFTTGTWNATQTVTVTGAEDFNAVTDNTHITHTVTGADYADHGITADPVAVTVTDNDTPRVTISTDRLTVPEGGSGAYTVRLATQPGNAVVVTPTSDTPAAAATVSDPLTFTAANWNAAQTVRISAAEDDLDFADATATIRHAVSGYPGVASAAAVTVTIDDNDRDEAPAFAVGAAVDEQIYAVGVGVDMTLPAAVAGGNGVTTYALAPLLDIPSGLAFNPATRVLSGTPERVAAAVMLTYTAVDSDANTGAGDEARLTFAVTVNAPAVVIARAELTIAEGAADTYAVSLATPPSGAVTVTPVSDNPAKVPSPRALTFAAGEWNIAQAVTVRSVRDADAATDTATLSHAVHGYAGATPSVVVTVTDTDSDPALSAVAAQRYTVGVAVDVTLPAARDGDAPLRYALDVSALPGLIFTADTRVVSGAPTTATATPVRLTYTVTDGDGDTAGVAFEVAVTNAPGVTILPRALTVLEGAAGAYTVRLNSRPGGDVTVTPRSGDDAAATVSAAALVFTADNWHIAQAVAVIGVEDDNGGDETVTISHAVISSSGGGAGDDYAGITAADVTVAVTDDDIPALTVEPTRLVIDEGASETYTVTLVTKPDREVTITLRVAHENAHRLMLTSNQKNGLTFTTDDWNIAQTVIVTAGEDEDAANGSVVIMHEVDGYDGVTRADDVEITVADNDAIASGGMDTLNRALLPEVARVLADQGADVITERIARGRAAARAGVGGGRVSVGGQSTLAGALATHGQTMAEEDGLDFKTILGGSDFVLPLGAGVPGEITGPFPANLWGGGDYRRMRGEDGELRWDGRLLSAHLGLDASLGDDVLAGVALSWSEADFDYDGLGAGSGSGEYEMTLTSLHPYIGWSEFDGLLNLWATAGYGEGGLSVAPEDGRRAFGDVLLHTYALGANGALLASAERTLLLKGEIKQTRLQTFNGTGISEMAVEVEQARLSLESRHTLRRVDGTLLSPSFEVGIRHDDGEAGTGAGAEMGGRLRYLDATRRLTLEAHGRVLVMHSSEHREWGIGGTVRREADASGRGLSFSLSPAYGHTDSGVQQMWREGLLNDGANDDGLEARMKAQVGYGLSARGGGLLTPYTEITLGETNRRYRLGARWEFGEMLDLELSWERDEEDDASAEHAVLLEGEVRF